MLIELFIFWVSCFFKRKETAIQAFNVRYATNGLYIGIKKKAFPRHPTRSSHTQEIRSRRDSWIATLWFCSVISAQNRQQQESSRQIDHQWAQTVQTNVKAPEIQSTTLTQPLISELNTPNCWIFTPDVSITHISSSYSSC